MGSRGPAPKDPQRRQRNHVGDARRVEVVALPRRDEVPAAPEGLSEVWAAAWGEFWATDISRTVTPEALPALVRLFRYRGEQDRIRAELADLNEKVAEEPFVAGSKGQPVANPMYGRIEHLERQLLALERIVISLEDRFGLHPRERAALNASVVDTAKSLGDLNARYGPGRSERPDPRFAPQEAPASPS